MTGFASIGVYTQDDLRAGDFPIVGDSLTIASGESAVNTVRGALMGKVTATDKLKFSLSASTDGSQNPYCILSADADASAADSVAPVYLSGEFNQNQVKFGTGHTAISVKDSLRALSIFLTDPA